MPSHGFYTWSRLCPRCLCGWVVWAMVGPCLGETQRRDGGISSPKCHVQLGAAMESQVFPCWASRTTSCRWRFLWSVLVIHGFLRIMSPYVTHAAGHSRISFPRSNCALSGAPSWAAEVWLLDDQSADPVFARLHRCVYHCRNPDPLGPPVGPLLALALENGREKFRQQANLYSRSSEYILYDILDISLMKFY